MFRNFVPCDGWYAVYVVADQETGQNTFETRRLAGWLMEETPAGPSAVGAVVDESTLVPADSCVDGVTEILAGFMHRDDMPKDLKALIAHDSGRRAKSWKEGGGAAITDAG